MEERDESDYRIRPVVLVIIIVLVFLIASSITIKSTITSTKKLAGFPRKSFVYFVYFVVS